MSASSGPRASAATGGAGSVGVAEGGPADPRAAALGAALDALATPAWVAPGPEGPEVLAAPPGDGRRAAYLPPCRPADLGAARFRARHGIRFAWASGAMANGIGSVEVVEAMARAGMLSFFGSAGLDVPAVGRAVDRLRASAGDLPWGVNFIHSPGEPAVEDALADLLLDRGVPLVEASAFMDLTPAIVRYRARGMRCGPDGAVLARHRVVAKVSRVEVATKFLSPAPERVLRDLVAAGRLTEDEARCAARVPVAEDLTVEADSGGHTDNRPALALLPTMLALRDRLAERFRYAEAPCVGAAGGIATPASAAAAFAMGAGYCLTGTVNQACVEAGTSDAVRAMLAAAEQADVIMAPAADMFEMGVKVQVLKRGTMFAMRAQRLYDLYRAHASLEALPPAEREHLEKHLFRAPLEEVWSRTREFFAVRDPAQVERAAADAHHRMALVFRWYLGMSSRWANAGDPDRRLDYQVWCGPAMGAFNEWARGSFLEAPENRRVAAVNGNLLAGAARVLRCAALRMQGVEVPPAVDGARPLPPDVVERRLAP